MSCPAFHPLPTKSPVVPPKLPLQLLVSKYFTYNSFVYRILRGFSPISLKTRILRRGGGGTQAHFPPQIVPKWNSNPSYSRPFHNRFCLSSNWTRMPARR